MASPKTAKWLILLLWAGGLVATAQSSLPQDAHAYVEQVIQNELKAQNDDHTHWMYRLHRESDKSSYDREIIETKEGSIAKTLLVNDQPLTTELTEKDDERMKKLVDDPQEQAKRERRAKEDGDKARQLFKAIPDAFLFAYNGTEEGLVRVAFRPNPGYSAPNREIQVYHSLTGEMWIDPSAMRMVKIEAQLFEDVNFGWGLLGHLKKGGTFKVVQRDVGGNHWEIMFLDVNMQGRAVIFKTITVKTKQVFSDFHRVADNLTLAQGMDVLEKTNESTNAGKESTKAGSAGSAFEKQ